MSHREYEAVQENCLEEIRLSTGITKAMNIALINKRSYPTQEEKVRWEQG